MFLLVAISYKYLTHSTWQQCVTLILKPVMTPTATPTVLAVAVTVRLWPVTWTPLPWITSLVRVTSLCGQFSFTTFLLLLLVSLFAFTLQTSFSLGVSVWVFTTHLLLHIDRHVTPRHVHSRVSLYSLHMLHYYTFTLTKYNTSASNIRSSQLYSGWQATSAARTLQQETVVIPSSTIEGQSLYSRAVWGFYFAWISQYSANSFAIFNFLAKFKLSKMSTQPISVFHLFTTVSMATITKK